MVNFGLLAAVIGPSLQRYCTACSSGRQPNFAALNRGRHLCSAGRPSRWTLALILVVVFLDNRPIEWTSKVKYLGIHILEGGVQKIDIIDAERKYYVML